MTEPTDDELLALIEKHLGLKPRRDDTVIDPRTGRFHDVQRYRDLKADILAKWGTPPAGAGEHKPGCPALGGYGHGVGECCCGTTPQPTQAQAGHISGAKSFQTYAEANAYSKGYYAGKKAAKQAQAGAVPLTVDEVEQLIAQWSYELHGDRARYLVRMTEQHHGIKGGQHGAE